MTRLDRAPVRFLTLAAILVTLTVAWLCGACGGAYAWHKPTRAEVPVNATAQIVTRRMSYLIQQDVPTGWRRLMDPLTGPYYFLFSTQGYACLTNAADWTMARDHEEWLCEWRIYR